jgi:hypothetical protein
MSFDIGDPNRYVFYVNFQTIGNGSGFAQARQNFNFAQLIEDSSRYVVSVERARIPLQGIPMLPLIQNVMEFVPVAGGSGPNPGLGNDLTLRQTFSINEFLTQFQEFGIEGLIISLTSDGRINIIYDNWQNFIITFDTRVAAIFDMGGDTIGAGFLNNQEITGNTPIFDRFDDLHSISIESTQGLTSVQQEIFDSDVFNIVLVDLLVGSSEGMTYSGTRNLEHDSSYTVNYPIRSDLELQAGGDRRWVMLKGTAPIQSIALEAIAIFRDGTRNNIVLPPRTIFSLKLAFWRKGLDNTPTNV